MKKLKLSNGDYYCQETADITIKLIVNTLVWKTVLLIVPETVKLLKSELEKIDNSGLPMLFLKCGYIRIYDKKYIYDIKPDISLKEKIEDIVFDWAHKLNLYGPWFEKNYNLMLLYYFLPKLENWRFLDVSVPPKKLKKFNFNYRAFDPLTETWQEYKKKVEEFCKTKLEKYEEITKNEIKKTDYIKTPELRKPEHFEWFVLYQVKGWELSQVADYISKKTGKFYEDSNIYKNVEKIAELAGITLRKGYR